MNAETEGRDSAGEMRPVCGGVHKGMAGKDACGMYVRGKVGHSEVEILIDSGANISIINYETYGMIDHEERPVLKVYGIPMVTPMARP
jgi:hypothetical protein